MKLKNRILSWSTVILLAISALCYGAASDYKVTNDGVVHSYGFTTSQGITANWSIGLGWVDVRSFMDGLSGRPTYATWYANQATTDVILVLNAANAAANGVVYFPSGIYAISSTFALRSATEYVGPLGGTFPYTGSWPTHPVAGYGAALKWIGAASGVMVEAYGTGRLVWRGIDLDGVDPANNVTGIKLWSINSPPNTHFDLNHFMIFNCGTGMHLGHNATGTHYQTDIINISDFHLYNCETGIYLNSQNTKLVKISHGGIASRDIGINFNNVGGPTTIDTIGFGTLVDNPATGAIIRTNVFGSALNIIGCQAETTNAGWLFLEYTSGSYAPINITGSDTDMDWEIAGSCKIMSMGNSYGAATIDLTSAGGAQFISMGDQFSGAGTITDSGGHNSIVQLAQYNATDTSSVLLRNIYDNLTIDKKMFGYWLGGIEALADEATPSIKYADKWITGGTTTITHFDDGYPGQVITIISEHSITITDGTNIFLNGSANFVMKATDTLVLIQKTDGKWYEIGRSVN